MKRRPGPLADAPPERGPEAAPPSMAVRRRRAARLPGPVAPERPTRPAPLSFSDDEDPTAKLAAARASLDPWTPRAETARTAPASAATARRTIGPAATGPRKSRSLS